ncbi:MAG: AMP-binding protein, partial [bacterium]|nr:AMP-binding protein [bacterium]
MNSVIQNFFGHNYLRQVMRICINLLNEQGTIFIGDIMDQDLKQDLVRETREFKEANRDKGFRTTTDYSNRLFVSRSFWLDLRFEIPGIRAIDFSKKMHTIKNELTAFRYDALISVAKSTTAAPLSTAGSPAPMRHKYQEDLRMLTVPVERSGEPPVPVHLHPVPPYRQLAYVLYTSGTTGKPKGAMVRHLGMV